MSNASHEIRGDAVVAELVAQGLSSREPGWTLRQPECLDSTFAGSTYNIFAKSDSYRLITARFVSFGFPTALWIVGLVGRIERLGAKVHALLPDHRLVSTDG